MEKIGAISSKSQKSNIKTLNIIKKTLQSKLFELKTHENLITSNRHHLCEISTWKSSKLL
jgi:hypothetical protein